jgi:nucleotide-binding universal stress UspA family protein
MSTDTIERTHRTVVGVDGTAASLAALDWAAARAASTGSTVVAVAVWEWPRGFGQAVLIPSDYDPAGDAESMVRTAVDEARRRHPDVGFLPMAVEGRAADVLVEASRGADLLAVGSRGHGEVAGLLVGSVSEHCATHAHSPVLVVRDRP